MIESAQYSETGNIVVVVDGSIISVPDDMANRHRRKLAAWEANGNTIAPYVASAPTAKEIRDAEFIALPDRADLLTRLQSASPAQIDTWVDNRVTNLATARDLFKLILKLIALDGRQ